MNSIQQPRRKFLQTGVVGFCTAFFAGIPKISFGKSGSTIDKGIVVRENEGTHLLTRRRVPINIKISKSKHGIDGISFALKTKARGARCVFINI